MEATARNANDSNQDPNKAQRVEWVDCCKGVCILLVVYGHIAGGLESSGVLGAASVFAMLRDWVYLFHIPAFFFLSGLFAFKTARLPFGQFLKGRLRTLFYPYLLWTAIILASQLAVGSFVNTPASFTRALQCLWEPYGVGLWFLYSLFLISVLFGCLQRLRLPVIAILLLGVAVYVPARYNVFGFWYILNESMIHAIYFLIGGCFPGIVAAPLKNARWPSFLAGGIFLLVLMTLSQRIPNDPAGLMKLARALVGVAGVVCVAVAIARTAMATAWALLGTYSLEIYLAHPLWGTAVRGVLLRSGVRSPLLFVVCGVSLGVVGSLAVAVACKRLGFPYLFRWPAARRQTVASGAAAGGGAVLR